MTRPSLSVVVPLYNEEESVAALVDSVATALADADPWELILVDDGSSDDTGAVAAAAADRDGRVRVLRLAANFGQTAAMQAGFDHARGEIVVSMDGDLQNDPRDIPLLVATLRSGYDLVAGYRVRRKDRLITRLIPSWVANRIIRWMTGVPIRDNGCSLKAYRRDLLRRVHLYSDMHRFIPAVAAACGARITEVPVRHHPRRFGHSKYGMNRVAKVLADLLTISMIRSFRERPLVMFGLAATMSLLLSLVFVLADLVARHLHGEVVALVFPGAMLLSLGLASYLLMLGLVAETVVQGKFDSEPPERAGTGAEEQGVAWWT
jgi:glycosyltransferase involved in cell wall biosynthesis